MNRHTRVLMILLAVTLFVQPVSATASQQLLTSLGTLRRQHLKAVAELLKAIDKGIVSTSLNHQFKCPQ